jgi:hypothetical protein
MSGGGFIQEVATARNNGSEYNPQAVIRVNFMAVQQSQTINFADPADIATATPNQEVALSATASSGQPVSFTVTTPAVCSSSGSTATVIAAGNCRVNANQSGNANYFAAPQVSQTFTIGAVGDTTPPVVTVPNTITVNTDNGLATAVVTYSPSFTDNEPGGSITVSPSSGTAFAVGTTSVIATATDASGNSASDSFNVIVQDNEDPVVTPPSDISVNVDAGTSGAVATFTASATDNVPGVTLSYVPVSGSTFAVGTTSVTATATDVAGNTASASFTVTVADNEAPVITAPATASAATTAGQPTGVVSFSATATDVVDGSISPTFTSSPTAGLSPGSAFPIGTTIVSVRAQDEAGNVATQNVIVTVTDGEDPTISVPTDITVDTDAESASAVVSYDVTGVDNSGAVSPVLTSGPASGSAFPVGTTSVTWTVTDASGNSASDSFNVIVQDNEAPTVSVPTDISVGTDPELATAVVTFTPTVLDAVDGALTPNVVSSPKTGLISGSAFPIGSTTVTVSGADSAGNSASDIFLVTVTDDQAPTFTSTQPDINVEIDFNLTSAVVNFPTPTAADNSGIVNVAQTQGPVSGSAFPLGTTLVEFTATDGAGLTDTLSFNVTASQIAPGTVTFMVNSPDDGTVNFTSTTAALNTSVAVSGGSGDSGGLQVVPGIYTATYALPVGFAVTSAICSSVSGAVSIASQTISMTFARGEAYTCTLSSRDIASQTQDQIQNFMGTRGRLIAANQPSRGRRIARVNRNSNPNTVSMLGHTLTTVVSPFGVEIGESQIQLSFSSAKTDPLTVPTDWELWVESSFSRYETSGSEGSFGILHSGADYRIAENSVLGFGLQLDTSEEDVTGADGTTTSLGWMVGPYYTTKIGEGLYFDASLRYGRSDIKISPLGTYVDEFSTERWLANVALFGSYDQSETLNIQPSVAINYFEETSEAYTDTLLVPIASMTTRFGELEAGSRFTWSDPMGRYSTFFELNGIYKFEAGGSSEAATTANTGLRGRAGLGGSIAVGTSGVIDYGLTYDGLGDDSYEAISVTLGYTMNL